MTKVSVILPVYNVEKYLRECLDSVVNQTLEDIEIICVNDGSTDESPKILEEYAQKDERIKIINQTNSGQSEARNSGMKVATGEYIGFIDSDDWVDLDFFEKLYNSAIKYKAEIAVTNFQRKNKKRLNYKKEKLFIKPEDKIKSAYIPLYNYVWNKIYKRNSLMALNLPFEKGRSYEDMLWLVKVVYHLKGLVTVPNTFYHYRLNTNSITAQRTAKHLSDLAYADEQIISFMKEHNIPILLNLTRKSKITIIKFLGITLLTIKYYYPNTTKYKLFGFLTLLTIEKLPQTEY